MLLAVDIGNTKTALGLFDMALKPEAGRLEIPRHVWSLDPKDIFGNSSAFECEKALRNSPLKAIIIASVNRTHLDMMTKWFFSLGFGAMIKCLGRDLQIPIKNNAKKPQSVGQDRLINAVAAYHLTAQATLAIDFGTALTIDVVSSSGAYEGGVIMPGISLSLKALAEGTDLLPEVELKPSEKVTGRDTEEAIRSGYYWGYQGMISFLIRKFNEEYACEHKILFTGGSAAMFAAPMGYADKVQPHLTLFGIALCHVAKES